MENKLREYAKLLIEVGLNVQKGQTVVIRCPVECAFFARLCASAAYDVGCREVVMRWTDDYMNRERFLRRLRVRRFPRLAGRNAQRLC